MPTHKHSGELSVRLEEGSLEKLVNIGREEHLRTFVKNLSFRVDLLYEMDYLTYDF